MEWEVKEANEAVLTARFGDDYIAHVKWDGCVDLDAIMSLEQNEQGEWVPVDMDYMHICNIDKHIEALTKLKTLAIEKFPGGWPR